MRSLMTPFNAISLCIVASLQHVGVLGNRERKFADTIGAVLVPWAHHFQC